MSECQFFFVAIVQPQELRHIFSGPSRRLISVPGPGRRRRGVHYTEPAAFEAEAAKGGEGELERTLPCETKKLVSASDGFEHGCGNRLSSFDLAEAFNFGAEKHAIEARRSLDGEVQL